MAVFKAQVYDHDNRNTMVLNNCDEDGILKRRIRVCLDGYNIKKMETYETKMTQ